MFGYKGFSFLVSFIYECMEVVGGTIVCGCWANLPGEVTLRKVANHVSETTGFILFIGGKKNIRLGSAIALN